MGTGRQTGGPTPNVGRPPRQAGHTPGDAPRGVALAGVAQTYGRPFLGDKGDAVRRGPARRVPPRPRPDVISPRPGGGAAATTLENVLGDRPPGVTDEEGPVGRPGGPRLGLSGVRRPVARAPRDTPFPPPEGVAVLGDRAAATLARPRLVPKTGPRDGVASAEGRLLRGTGRPLAVAADRRPGMSGV